MRLPSANLIIIGKGDDKSKLKNLTKKMGLSQNIHFFGNVQYSEIPKFLHLSKIGLSPIPPTFYYKLSSPLKLFEYMGANLPVVINKEILEHFFTIKESEGGKVVPYDENAFASEIINLLNNPEKLKEYGDKNYKWVNQNRTYKKISDQLEFIFNSKLKKYKKLK